MAGSALSIPLIDITGFQAQDPARRDETVAAIGAASEQFGFMRIIGHAIAPATVDETFARGQMLFAGPSSVRDAVRDKISNRGYIPLFDNVYPGERPAGQESFSMGCPQPPSDSALLELPFYAPTPWPAIDGFQEAYERCYHEMFGLGQTVLQAMALHLGRSADFFTAALRDTYSNMRCIHYPQPDTIADATDFGSRPHEDRGMITLLIQDGNGGLEVMDADGDWIEVDPDTGSVIVNVGRLLRLWTNGRYRSAIHRVVNRSGRSRQSIPLFVHPNFYQRIDPADFTAPGEAPRFEAVTAGEHTYTDFATQRPSWARETAAE